MSVDNASSAVESVQRAITWVSARGVGIAGQVWFLLCTLAVGTTPLGPARDRVIHVYDGADWKPGLVPFIGSAVAFASWRSRRTLKRIGTLWYAMHITRRRLRVGWRAPWRLRFPLLRAIHAEVGVTPMQRHTIAWRHLMETRNISPVPKLARVTDTPLSITYSARLNPAGFSAAQFEDFADGIRTAIGDCQRVDVYGDRHNGQIVNVRVVKRDATDRLLGAWPHLRADHGSFSIADGVPVGVNSNGGDARLDLVNLAAFVSGQRGTGKSVFMQQIVAYAALCGDVQLWLGDGKEGAEFGLWAGKVHRLGESPEEIDRMINDLLRERERRAHAFKALGVRKWTPDTGVPFILLAIDEIAELGLGDANSPQTKLTKLVRLGRAQGIGFIAATQRPSNKWVDTSLRAQCNLSISFKVRDATEAGIALGQGSVSEGMKPHLLPRFRFIVFDDAEDTGLRHIGWNLTDTQIKALAARLPAAVPEQSEEGSDQGSDRTDSGAPMERTDDGEGTESDTPWPAPVGDGPDTSAKPARARVWQVLVDHPGWMPPASIMKLSGAAKDTVHSALNDWIDDGWVEKAGGQYRRRDARDWRSDLAS